MPGITGMIGRATGLPATPLVLQMTASLCREELHVAGSHAESDGRLAIGWVTAADDSDSRLIWNGRSTIGLLWTGEIFSNASGFGRLSPNGRGLAHSMAAQLLEQYENDGVDCLKNLNGCFSGLIIDRRDRTSVLFNDRFGLSRVYYYESSDGFQFSSEAKSLLGLHPSQRRIDERGLAEFFSVGCVLQNRTLFPGIALLPPASAWSFDQSGVIKRATYFTSEAWEQQASLSAEDYTARLIDVFGRIAPRYFAGNQKVAMSLTGGLDSRMLLAWAKASPGTLPCYTFGGSYRDCADLSLARQLALVAQQPHTTLPVGRDFLNDFPALAEQTVSISDGTMDVSGAVELYVNRLARKIAPVRLTGNYGSEILRSNVAFRPAKLDTSIFTPEFGELIEQAKDTYQIEAAVHRLSFIAFKQVPWHHYGRRSIEASQLTPRSPFLDNELVALAYQAPQGQETSAQPLLELIAAGNPALESVPTDRMHQRRPSTAARLRQQWQEFTAKAEYAYDYGMPPWLAKVDRAAKPLHLEKLFLGRHKFYHFRIWYREQLGVFLKNTLSQSQNPFGCYRDGVVARMVDAHVTGTSNHTSALHRILTLHLTEKLFTGMP